MKISVQQESFDVYVARPEALNAPVVVVVQEIFGVNADLRETCEELAAKGFIAMAPDLFWRSTPNLDLNSWSEAEWRQGLDLYERFDVDLGIADLAATIEAARVLPGASGKVGITGFCLGGLMTYLAATRLKVDAAVAYYGGGTDKYLGEARGLSTPLMMHLGQEDEFIPDDAQESIVAALQDKPDTKVHLYPGCSHAFARHTGCHYDATAAEAANDRTVSFLRQHLTLR